MTQFFLVCIVPLMKQEILHYRCSFCNELAPAVPDTKMPDYMYGLKAYLFQDAGDWLENYDHSAFWVIGCHDCLHDLTEAHKNASLIFALYPNPFGKTKPLLLDFLSFNVDKVSQVAKSKLLGLCHYSTEVEV